MNFAEFQMKNAQRLADFTQMSGIAGVPKHVQGGGGNTSVKLEGGWMAIKASGFRLDDITPDNAYALLEYAPVAAFYNDTDPAALGGEVEPRGAAVAKEYTIVPEGMEARRPSVEAGTHVLLNTFVIHTHSVYALLACCAPDPEARLAAALGDLPFCYVPYVDPGARLTFAVRDAIAANPAGRDLIFLQNHGIIACGETAGQALTLHQTVTQRLGEVFKAPAYPRVSIEQAEDGAYISATRGLREKLADFDKDWLRKRFLYPDQMVYLADADDEKLSGVYRVNATEALCLEELLCALLFLHDVAMREGYELQPMSAAAQSFIGNWESEKYRKSLTQK